MNAAGRSLAGALSRDRYSRRVALLRLLLPALGVALLLLVAAWPRLRPLIESVGLRFPAIDLRAARELTMVDPRYSGLDRRNRPYTVTAAVARQIPDRNDLLALKRPKAHMMMAHGDPVVITAASGMYQSQAQLLDLSGGVDLLRRDGTHFQTSTAHVNFADNTADGHDRVVGHGPQGDVTGQGFRIRDKGNTVIFTGTSTLFLRGGKPTRPAPMPPALPPALARTAAAIEAAAVPRPEEKPRSPDSPVGGTDPR
ncbi:MAG TPA: LPS export ABC transporter periplasmic protein LptC [Stellaceae bacterium]|nr:LPS export ABC transporter periplasmic protein LptC [Stellaceae bacterium]